MPEGDVGFSIDPHRYLDVVLDLPEELIPRQLAQELGRCGTLDLWRYQAFDNHLHSDFPGEPEERLQDELRGAATWARTLQAAFPT